MYGKYGMSVVTKIVQIAGDPKLQLKELFKVWCGDSELHHHVETMGSVYTRLCATTSAGQVDGTWQSGNPESWIVVYES